MKYQNYDERKVTASMLCKDDIVRENGHTYRVFESNPDSSAGGTRTWHLRLRNPDRVGGIEVWTSRDSEYTLLIPRVNYKRYTVDAPRRMGHTAYQFIVDEVPDFMIKEVAEALAGRAEKKEPVKRKVGGLRQNDVIWFDGEEVLITDYVSHGRRGAQGKMWSTFQYAPVDRLDDGGINWSKTDKMMATVPRDTVFEMSDVFDD